METSKALVVMDKNVLEFQKLAMPEVGDYEVLFHTKACSLCTLDRRTFLGTRNYQLPFLGGHECSGVIEKVGKGVVEVRPGDKAIFTSGYCMQCGLDRSGRGTQCRNKGKMPKHAAFEGWIQGGGLSEYLSIPAWQIIRMPDDVDFNHACLTEPLACCVHSIRKARITMGDTVMIIGLGIMGYLQMKLALMQGARVVVSETDPGRQEKARANGAHVVVDPSKEDAVKKLRSLTNGLGADVVVNTVAAHGVWPSAIDMLAPYGRLIAYSSQDSREPVGIDFGMVHHKEIELIGTLNPTLEDNEIAAKLIGFQLIDMDRVIDRAYPFEQGVEAFRKACEPGAYRVIINY